MESRQDSVRREYIQLLNKLTGCILRGNTRDIRNIFETLLEIICSENQEFLLSLQNDSDNPLSKSNLIIFACKNEQYNVLEYLFNAGERMLINLYKNVGIDLIHPSYSDSCKHNAFYYAIRSNNVKVVDMLIEKWPGVDLGKNIECFEDILSGSYQALTLRNVTLSLEMQLCIESRLLNFRLAINEQLHNPGVTLTQIIARMDWLISKIHRTLNEDFGDQTDILLQNLKTIAKNIYVLKASLKSTYDAIPWEEMEFCLTTFVRTRIRDDELNILYWSFITKSALISHLNNFTKCLEAEKIGILDQHSVDTLKSFPTIKRDQAVKLIIRKYPFFQTLYYDFQKARDVRSLEVINEYTNVSLTSDIEEKTGRLIIVRTLQVVSQCFKNTFEAPKLSDEARKRLLGNLEGNSVEDPRYENIFKEVNIRKIIIDIRNSLSTSFVLSKQAEKEDKDTVEFFAKILIGMKRLNMVVKNMIDTGIFLQIKRYFRVLLDCNDLDTVEEIMKLFRSMKPRGLTISGNLQMLEVWINKLRARATSSPHCLFLINNVNMCLANILPNNVSGMDLADLKLIVQQFVIATGLNICGNDDYKLETIQSMAKDLEAMFSKFDSVKLSRKLGFGIIDFLNTITSHISKEAYYDVYMLASNVINIIELLDENLESIEELHNKLTNHSTKFPFDYFEPESSEKIEKDRAANRTLEIENITGVNNYKDKTKNYQLLCEESKGMQLILELLMVETLCSMGYTHEAGCTNDHAFVDARVPILTGTNLLDYLIHKPDIVELCSYSSATFVAINAGLIASGNFEEKRECLNEKHVFDVDKLVERDCQINNVLCFQLQLLRALSDGKMDAVNFSLENGADIFGRYYDNTTALHQAAKGRSSEPLEYVLDQWKGKIDEQNMDGMNPLHLAAYNGQVENVQLLLSRGKIPVDAPDKFGRTALHYSVSTEFINVTKMLMKFKADPNAISEEGHTPLKEALYSKNVEASKLILEHAEFLYGDTLGSTPLGVAAEKGLSELLPALIKLEAKHPAQRISSTVNKLPTPLHYAAKHGHIECLKILLQNGWNMNAKVFGGETPFHWALMSNEEEVVRFMLEKGADARDGRSIFLAVSGGNKKIVEMLISAKAPVNVIEFTLGTPLHLAAGLNRRDIVELLLKNGVLANVKNNRGQTALHYCAEKGYYKLSKLLIKYGAKTNIGDTLNHIPYFYAVFEGHQHIVELMVTSTNINHVESSGYTALHWSCQDGNTGIVRYLLGKGINVNAKTNNGRTSLHIATLNSFIDITNLLLRKGATINVTDNHGNTPLHYAAMVGQAKVVEMLIQRGALINIVNEHGWTPLHMACSSGSLECTSLLVNKGCSVNASAKGGVTPLFMSVASNNMNIVKFLINQKVNIDNEALRRAVQSGFADILELLLVSFPNTSKDTELLLTAVIKRHPEIIKILVKRGADVNKICTETGEQPLHLAVMLGDYEIIKLLLDLGADPNGRSLKGDIPLHRASESGHLETVVAILTNKSQILAKDSEGRTPLGTAVANGHANVVELFLNKYKTLNINNYSHTNQLMPLLHLAACSGKTEVVKLLVQKGADINGRMYNGWKAIHVAAFEGFADIVEFFLLRGMSLYDSTENGNNLLHYVAKGNGDRLSVAKLLVSNKRMDLNRCNNLGWSPLHFAVLASNDIRLIKFFLENGSYYDAKTNEGRGMKDIATKIPIRSIFHSVQQLFTEGKRGNLSLVENSIREGAIVNAKNERNETPLLCATWKGNANVVMLCSCWPMVRILT